MAVTAASVGVAGKAPTVRTVSGSLLFKLDGVGLLSPAKFYRLGRRQVVPFSHLILLYETFGRVLRISGIFFFLRVGDPG